LVKRTESPWQVGQFGGFVPAAGGSILSKPTARTRQIEFIGDSDADDSFSALTAHSLNADYEINAMSGMGMVRNYDCTSAGTDFRTYYGRTQEAVNNDVWYNPGTWHPQLVVVGLGINDFSTALNSGEQWSASAQLVTAYAAAYQRFINTLRQQYGPITIIVVSATALSVEHHFLSGGAEIRRGRRGISAGPVVAFTGRYSQNASVEAGVLGTIGSAACIRLVGFRVVHHAVRYHVTERAAALFGE
jgi:hypothetical protein